MRNLYYGDRGIRVVYLQLALNRAGYPLRLDGIFGNQTCTALQNFLGGEGACIVDAKAMERLLPYLRGYQTNQEGSTTFFSFPVVFPGVKYTSFLTQQVIYGLAKRYSTIETGSIGKSVMGKEIYYLKIGKGKTEVFYNASFHANESITTPLLLKFAEDYAAAYAAGEEIGGAPAGRLYENYTLYLVPLVNPDGVDLVNGWLERGSYFRQAEAIAENYPEIPFPSGWKANIDGIDLNLQYPAGWEEARAIKAAAGYTSPAPRDYVGEAPLSAPESRAVYDFTRRQNFSLILAYHTQGEVIYWKYLDYNPVNSYEIAQYFGRVSGYAVEETPSASGYAGYKDWFILEYNRPGYTIEAGKGENPLPVSQFPSIYEKNIGILVGGMMELGVV